MLHIDKNDYYGGAEAALSLQEVEAWADTVNEGNFIAIHLGCCSRTSRFALQICHI